MHSSTLRGSDFEIVVDGGPRPHAEYFLGHTKTRRLALVAPNRTDGAGAINLIMAYVTAFYDDYRSEGDEFFAYPDFFSIQQSTPLADYAMYDIWPSHKLVHAEADPSAVLQAVTDRGANILVVPDGEPTTHEFHKVVLASARRNIDRCYVYGSEGRVRDGDVTIRCDRSPFDDWAGSMFDSLGDDSEAQAQKERWLAEGAGDDRLEQTFRRVGLDEALGLLVPR
jgi:hypothetical protein